MASVLPSTSDATGAAPSADNAALLAAYGIDGCGCFQCVEKTVSARPWPDNLMYPFIVCATCGNKRCPHAESHDLSCTGSNESGQAGAVRYRVWSEDERRESREKLDRATAEARAGNRSALYDLIESARGTDRG